jgi:hypothetical protein
VGAVDATILVEESGARLRVAAEAGYDNDITGVRLVTGVFEISDPGDRVDAAVSIATSPSSGATEPTGCGRPATPP